MKCTDLDKYLVDFLEDDLDNASLDEVLDHLESCAACREEFKVYKKQDERLRRYYTNKTMGVVLDRIPESVSPSSRRPSSSRPLKWTYWAAAAVLLIGLVGGIWSVYELVVPHGTTASAFVDEVEGRVGVMDKGGVLDVGDVVIQAERIKVSSGGYLALRLLDGNVIEARGGTQFSLQDFPDRLELVMNRGHVLAHLKTPPEKKFVVRTAHLTAAAVGTVYGVEEGLDRSVVQVAEGTVLVESRGTETTVSVGETLVTGDSTQTQTSGDSVSWSHYPEDLASLTAEPASAETPSLTVASAGPVAEENDSSESSIIAFPPSIPLVNFLPEDTLYLLEVHDWRGIVEDFRATSYGAFFKEDSLVQWWNGLGGEKVWNEFLNNVLLDEILEAVKLMDGDLLAAVTKSGKFILIAECRSNEEEVGSIVRRLIAEHASATYGNDNPLVAVDSGCLFASSDRDLLVDTVRRSRNGETTTFVDGEFYKKIMRDVQNPRFIMAADLGGQVDGIREKIAGEGQEAEFERTFNFVGLPGLDYFLLSPSFSDGGMNHAVRLAFIPTGRYGMMNWLAEPAPMRGLDFLSADVHLFASAIIRSPRQMLLDYLRYLQGSGKESEFVKAGEFIADNEAFLASFGGEIVIGVDSPILPIPNVKIVVEVDDQETFKEGLQKFLVKLQQDLANHDRSMLVEETEHKGFTIYTAVIDGVPIYPSWTFVDDYFVAGPGREFVRDSIDVYESGRSIANDSRLIELLHNNAEINYSLLVYQDVARSIPSFVKEKIMPGLGAAESKVVPNLDFLANYRAAGIFYAYARKDCVDLYLNTPRGIDLNLGMAVPLAANWLVPRTNIGQTLSKVAEAMVRLEDTAQAVEAFRLENGRLPQSLHEIAQPQGKYIGQVPEDPFALVSGETIRLIVGPAPDEITIYSIGPDKEDNLGLVEYNVAVRYDAPGDILLRIK